MCPKWGVSIGSLFQGFSGWLQMASFGAILVRLGSLMVIITTPAPQLGHMEQDLARRRVILNITRSVYTQSSSEPCSSEMPPAPILSCMQPQSHTPRPRYIEPKTVKPGLMHFNTSSAHLALLLDTILITNPVSHHNRKRLDPLQETAVSKYSLVNINPIRLRIVQLTATTCPHHFVTFMTTQSPNKQLGEP